MPTYKELKENHFVVSLTMIALVSGGISGLGIITGAYDAGHTSADELKVVTNQVTADRLRSSCATLSIQISLAEQAIWQMDQANENSQRLVEKKRGLRDMLSQYNDLKCAKILAKVGG